MELSKCPCCGDEPTVSGDCDNGYEALSACSLSMWQPTMDKLIVAWNRRYVCKDKNGKPVTTADAIICITPTGTRQTGMPYWDEVEDTWCVRVSPMVSHRLYIMSSIELIESEVKE